MNRQYLWLIVVVLLVGSVLTTMLASGQETGAKTQWEYDVVVMSWSMGATNSEGIEARLNELGEAGWELIGWGHLYYVLKRPVGN